MSQQKFKSKDKASLQKLRGGYYTPRALALFACKSVLDDSTSTILEPSFGDGNFMEACLEVINQKNINNAHLVGVELDSVEYEKGVERILAFNNTNTTFSFINKDFFNSFPQLKKSGIDCVVGNPPFIRFQYFDEESRNTAFRYLYENHYKPTKLANAWSAFVQLSIALLKQGGKLSMVIPAELLQVKYAGELRKRILTTFDKTTIIGFDKIVFPDILQEVVVLICEGKNSAKYNSQYPGSIRYISVRDGEELTSLKLNNYEFQTADENLLNGHKWTSLYAKQDSVRKLVTVLDDNRIKELGHFLSVNVGIVTGRNKFFVVDEETVNNYELEKFTEPLVGKTSALTSHDFTVDDYESYKSEYPAKLLNLKGVHSDEFTEGLKQYIYEGESENVHKGYKCRIRNTWYEVPSVYVSDGFLFRQIYKYPLLVSNSSKLVCTDTIHRVRLKDKSINMNRLALSFINSLTFAWSELYGRSYGGGVLELEPREAEQLPIIYSDEISLNYDYVRSLLKAKSIDEVLDYVDEKILHQHLNLSWDLILEFRQVWKDLSSRRLNRA
ncbi:SAM-dependent methyltransferase [Lewinellaceae bacterium SD302]|nr:SAM-dependent methyltransferase [Lewinellaceae bacterium SD302]